VNKKGVIFLQRLTAGFFLALFLFVHVAKAMHQHDAVPSFSKAISGAAEVSGEKDCSVCDYQLAEDSFHFNEFPQAKEIKQTQPLYSFYNTPVFTSIGSSSSGRGPPSFS
jgi:hypothetical protein